MQQGFQQKTGQTSENVAKAYGGGFQQQRMPNANFGSGLDTSSKVLNSDSKLIPSAPTYGNYGAVSVFVCIFFFFVIICNLYYSSFSFS